MSRLTYNQFGFNLSRCRELELNAEDLMILRWICDFYPKMDKIIQNNKEYGWICYGYLIENLQIIYSKEENISKRLKHYCQIGLLEKIIINSKDGKKAYFRMTEKFTDLYYDKDLTHAEKKSDGYLTHTENISYAHAEKKSDAYIYDSSTIDSSTIKNIKKENDFEQFYKIYTEKDKISNSKEYKTAENKFNKIVSKQDFNDILIKTQNYIDYLKEENKRGFKRQKKGILVFINQESWNGENGKDWIDLIEPKEIKTEEQKTESKIETQEKIKEIKKKVNTLEDFSDELLKDSNEIKRRRNDLFRDEQDKIFKSIKKDIYGDNEDYLENLSRDQKEIGIEKPQVDFEKLSFTNREKEDLENELKTRSGELAKCLNEKIGVEVATELIAKMVKKIVDYERESKYNTSFLELGKIKKAELVVYISEQSILFIDCLGDSYDYISTGKSSRFPDVEDLKRNVEKIKAEKFDKIKDIKLFIEYAQNENFIDELIKDYKEKYRYIFKTIKSLYGKREFA